MMANNESGAVNRPDELALGQFEDDGGRVLDTASDRLAPPRDRVLTAAEVKAMGGFATQTVDFDLSRFEDEGGRVL